MVSLFVCLFVCLFFLFGGVFELLPASLAFCMDDITSCPTSTSAFIVLETFCVVKFDYVSLITS